MQKQTIPPDDNVLETIMTMKIPMMMNLADAIAALAHNIGSQRDSSRTKVQEPDPFDGMDPAKLQTFLVQLQLSFNDRPSAFGNGRRKVNFAIFIFLFFESNLLCSRAMPYVTHSQLPRKSKRERRPETK